MNLFSKQKREPLESSPYVYKFLPAALKTQVLYILEETLGKFPMVQLHGPESFYQAMSWELRKEYGVTRLSKFGRTAREEVHTFFMQQEEAEKCIDVIQVFVSCAYKEMEENPIVNVYAKRWIEKCLSDLNERFREHRVGYEWRDHQVIRVDSEFLHAEAMVPALLVLREPYLKGANEEFLKAHEHFRHRRYAECINECLKTFESTMKAICHKRKWAYDQNHTAKKLLSICESHRLFPSFMGSSMGALLSTLEGVGTIRNKMSAHGHGVIELDITEEFASFALHTTAANVLFLSAREKVV